jgi:hypothetical protein
VFVRLGAKPRLLGHDFADVRKRGWAVTRRLWIEFFANNFYGAWAGLEILLAAIGISFN